MYETNSGSVRVGYVSGDDIRGGVPMATEALPFAPRHELRLGAEYTGKFCPVRSCT